MKYMKTMAVAMVLLAGLAQAQDNPIVTTVDSMKDKAAPTIRLQNLLLTNIMILSNTQADSWQQGKDSN